MTLIGCEGKSKLAVLSGDDDDDDDEWLSAYRYRVFHFMDEEK